jgi:hypothetical protein
MTCIPMGFPFVSARIPLIGRTVADCLDHPQSLKGQPVEWQHPLLVFLAENGTIPANTQEMDAAAHLVKTGRALTKSTTMGRMTSRVLLLPPRWAIPRDTKPPEYMLEFFAYQIIGYVDPYAHYTP